MILKTIDRYILSELLKTFFISLGALTMLLFLDKFLFLAEMIINRGVSVLEVVRIMTYISPAFLALTIPMSVLIASVVTWNQFSAYNEWVAMKACNMSFLRLMKSVMIFSVFGYLLANIVMFYALPWGNLSYKKLIYDIIQNRATLDIKPNVFNRDFKNLVLFTRDKKADSTLKHIFIADTTSPETPKIITADEGLIIPNPKILKIQLKLNYGTIHELGKSKSNYQTLNFDRYDLNLKLPDTERLQQEALVGNRELSFTQIRQKIAELKKNGQDTFSPEVELSKKFSIPFTCLLFGLLGAPLGLHSSRSGKSGSFAISIIVILVYYIALISTQNLGKIGKINSYFSVWIPNLVLLTGVIYMAYKMQMEKPFKIFDQIGHFIAGLTESIKKWNSSLFPPGPISNPRKKRTHRNQKKIDRAARELFDEKIKQIRSD